MNLPMQSQAYDPKDRAAEKQASRDEDRRRLQQGEISRPELRQQNSFFSFESLSILKSGGSPRRRR